MSVLIRGMVMPKNCFTCPFKNLEICDEDCPLIEVPPHGRLIDADAINYEDEIWKKKCIPPQVVYNAWVVAGEMPTIIEAEDGT